MWGTPLITALLDFPSLPQPPRLDELPVHVYGMVDVQQEAFAAVEEAEAEKVGVDKRRQRVERRVPDESRPGPADAPFRMQQVRDLRAVAVHVLQINPHRRVGVV